MTDRIKVRLQPRWRGLLVLGIVRLPTPLAWWLLRRRLFRSADDR